MMTRRTIPANAVGWTTKAPGHSAQPPGKHVVPAQRRVISLAKEAIGPTTESATVSKVCYGKRNKRRHQTLILRFSSE